MEAKQVFFASKDGTQVPMFVLHRKGLSLDGARPTILYGYGGWGISMVPAYRSTAVAWVEANGVYAIANIRGGGEYGEAWHRAGMRETKQNVFDDFLGGAAYLQENGYCSPATLGIEGGSNGGILVGSCITQAPDRFCSAVCSAPVLDMVRFDRMPGGQISYGELGNPNIAEEFAYLYAYSPYHHVVPGTEYPAVLFTVFESDSRVAPWHARKMCAALQAATTSRQPILYRREAQVGHAARSLSRSIELSVDTVAFHAHHLGLTFTTGT
jgi:prolyl oligopeptidase